MKLAFAAVDTWFFRDGTPFDRDGAPQAGVVGVFPPYPPTVAGAVRAAVARRNGWDGRSRWTSALIDVLGDGPDDLGRLAITGPFILKDSTPVFPLPRHVVGVREGDAWTAKDFLRPGDDRVACDLGAAVRLPMLAGVSDRSPTRATLVLDKAIKPATHEWIELAGIRDVLRGRLPRRETIVSASSLWSAEPRIGIAREPASRTVVDGGLYSTRHARPDASVRVAVQVDGVPKAWHRPFGNLVPFGGESRVASCEPWPDEAKLDFDPEPAASSSVTLIALTPLLIDAEVLRGQLPLRTHGLRVVCACVDRPLRIGGWDSGERAPTRARNAVAPGGVLFCEVEEPDVWRRVVENGVTRLGDRTNTGFGLCAVGRVPAQETTT